MKVVVSSDFYGGWPLGVEKTYPHIFLRRDNWNDYGFETKFIATIFEGADDETPLGSVKIGAFGHATDENMRDVLPVESDRLGDQYFSLGQSMAFYHALAELNPDIQRAYADAMRDIPILQLPIEDLVEERVFEVSLLRTSSAREALDKAPELFGRAERRVDRFDFETKLDGAPAPHRISFDFAPDGLPHRVNALVGVNGVGKTQLMARLAMVLSQFEQKAQRDARAAKSESLLEVGTLDPTPSFYSVIAISFSAFDDFELPDATESDDFRYVYCGLRQADGLVEDEKNLSQRIPNLIDKMEPDRRDLAIDLIGRSIGRQITLDEIGSENFYRTLSAGQRIVANIVADLMLHLRSRSLVLLDEPETHLHPQLVSRLLSALHDLLEGFDSAAVIATHSPIVVQQVLARRVHIIRRVEDIPLIGAPDIETFGENLTEIVRIVFDAVESDRGYQEVLDHLLEANNNSVQAVEALFSGRLGFNAQAYLRARGNAG